MPPCGSFEIEDLWIQLPVFENNFLAFGAFGGHCQNTLSFRLFEPENLWIEGCLDTKLYPQSYLGDLDQPPEGYKRPLLKNMGLTKTSEFSNESITKPLTP